MKNKLRNFHVHRTTLDAFRVLALNTSLSFFSRQLRRVTKRNFKEIFRAFQRILLGHPMARNLHPLLVRELLRRMFSSFVDHF